MDNKVWVWVRLRLVLYIHMSSIVIQSPCTLTLRWGLDFFHVNVTGNRSTHCRAPEPQMLLNRFLVSLLSKFNKLKWP